MDANKYVIVVPPNGGTMVQCVDSDKIFACVEKFCGFDHAIADTSLPSDCILFYTKQSDCVLPHNLVLSWIIAGGNICNCAICYKGYGVICSFDGEHFIGFTEKRLQEVISVVRELVPRTYP